MVANGEVVDGEYDSDVNVVAANEVEEQLQARRKVLDAAPWATQGRLVRGLWLTWTKCWGEAPICGRLLCLGLPWIIPLGVVWPQHRLAWLGFCTGTSLRSIA